MNKIRIMTAVSLAALAIAPPAAAQTEADFYKGKNINLVIGFGPGGTYDFFGRLVARHMGKHIPGNPTIVPQNMPGAGSLRAANWLYAAAPKDGTAMATLSQSLAVEEATKNKAVTFKALEFNWIGRVTSNTEVHVLLGKSKGATLEGAKTAEVPVASTGPGSPSEAYPKLLNALFGTKFKLVRGYPGSTNGILAMEKGEVDGALTSWNTMKRRFSKQLADKSMVLLIQYTLESSPEIKHVPAIVDLAKNPDDRALLAFAASSAEIGRSIVAPPGLPPARAKTLRDAFDATMKDPELLAEIKKGNLDFEPANAARLVQIVGETLKTSPQLVERYQKILAAD